MKTHVGRAAPMAPELRREALIEATLPLLREYGAAVTTRQIAEASGVAEGTIFRAFPDKDTLVRCAFEKAFDETDTVRQLAAIDPALPLRQRLEAASALLWDRLMGITDLIVHVGLAGRRHLVEGSSHRRDEHAEKVVQVLTALIEPDRHRLRRTPDEVARLLRLLVFSVTHPGLSLGAPMSSNDVVTVLLDGVLEDSARPVSGSNRRDT